MQYQLCALYYRRHIQMEFMFFLLQQNQKLNRIVVLRTEYASVREWSHVITKKKCTVPSYARAPYFCYIIFFICKIHSEIKTIMQIRHQKNQKTSNRENGKIHTAKSSGKQIFNQYFRIHTQRLVTGAEHMTYVSVYLFPIDKRHQSKMKIN